MQNNNGGNRDITRRFLYDWITNNRSYYCSVTCIRDGAIVVNGADAVDGADIGYGADAIVIDLVGVGDGAGIGDGAVDVGDDSVVGDGAVVIVGDRGAVIVGDMATGVVCDGGVVSYSATIVDSVVIGDGATIGDEAIVINVDEIDDSAAVVDGATVIAINAIVRIKNFIVAIVDCAVVSEGAKRGKRKVTPGFYPYLSIVFENAIISDIASSNEYAAPVYNIS